MTDAEPGLVACLRQAIATHLAVPLDDISVGATLGDDLALDSLDVFAVLEVTGRLTGRPVTVNYRDPESVGKLGGLADLTVAEFVSCLTVR